jgi:hypothetical protein
MKVVLVDATTFSLLGFYSIHFSTTGHYVKLGAPTVQYVVLTTEVSLKSNTATSTGIVGTFILLSSNRSLISDVRYRPFPMSC